MHPLRFAQYVLASLAHSPSLRFGPHRAPYPAFGASMGAPLQGALHSGSGMSLAVLIQLASSQHTINAPSGRKTTQCRCTQKWLFNGTTLDMCAPDSSSRVGLLHLRHEAGPPAPQTFLRPSTPPLLPITCVLAYILPHGRLETENV
jgi:hypothetical protein